MAANPPTLDPDTLARSLPPRGRVMRWVTEAIGSGQLRIGQPLPSERVLAERIGVSRTAVRAALNEMAAEGAIDQPNGGRLRRVARAIPPHPPAPGSNVMNDTLAILSSAGLPQAAEQAYQEAFIKHQAYQAIERTGMHVMVISPAKLIERGLGHLLSAPPAGLLVVDEVHADSDAHRVLKACSAILPTVVHGNVPELDQYDRVVSDHYAGASSLTRWLIGRGCRRILRVWLTEQHYEWLTRRSKGHADTLAEAGLSVLPEVRIPSPERLGAALLQAPPADQHRIWNDQVRRLAGYLIEWFGGGRRPEERPDAIVCMTDSHALQVSAALRVFGLEPGRDVLVTGYDNNWHFSVAHRFERTPPAATVEKHNARCATALVQLLRERIAGQLPPERQCRSIEHELRPLIGD